MEDFKDVKSGYAIRFVSFFFFLDIVLYILVFCSLGFELLFANTSFQFLYFQNFNENPYFEDTKLTKTFTFFDDGTTKIVGTTIKWKEGMVLTEPLDL